jgi:hypothetical protein
VYRNCFATVKHLIQQAENPKPAMVISEEAAHSDNAILPNYVTTEVAHEKTEIVRPDESILIDNNCTDDQLDFGMPVSSGDNETD